MIREVRYSRCYPYPTVPFPTTKRNPIKAPTNLNLLSKLNHVRLELSPVNAHPSHLHFLSVC